MSNFQKPGGFPDANIDPREKSKKDFCMQYAKAAFSVYNDCPIGSVGFKNKDEYELNISYALGKQSIDKYKPLLYRGDDPSNVSASIDWKVIPIIPSKRQIALGNQEKEAANYDPTIDPIDPLAKDEVQEEIETLRSKIMIREQLNAAGMQDMAQMPALAPNKDEPEDLDGLDIIEVGYRHRTAMEVEQIVELALNANNYNTNIRPMVMQDLFDHGFAYTKDETIDNCSVGIRHGDVRHAILNYCSKPDFSDLIYFGELITIPVNQLLTMSSGQLTEDEVKQMYRMGNQNTYANIGINSWGSWSDWDVFWSKGKVLILDLEFFSTDRESAYEWTDRRNNKRFVRDNGTKKERDANFKNKSYRYVENVYRVKWVVGTDVAFDYGRQYNIPKEKVGKSYKARLSYHPVAINMRNMKAFSRTNALISCADAIQLAFYKYQDFLNKAIPSGFGVDLSVLEEVAIGSNGQNLSPAQILDLYRNQGVFIYRSKSLLGGEKMAPPFQQLISQVGTATVEFQNMININLSLIDSILGQNDLTNGSTPNPKTLNGATQAAIQGTNNALSDLYAAERVMTQKVTKNIIVRAQNIVTLGNAEKMTYALGAGTIKIFKSIKDIDKYLYSVSLESKPSIDEKNEFSAQVQIAQENQEVTIADVMMLHTIKNMKQKQMFLVYRVRKNKEQKSMEKQREMEMNGQIQSQSVQVSEQAKQQTLQTEWQLRIQYMQMEKDLDMQIMDRQQQYMLEAKRIDASGRVEASFIQAKERDASNIRNNATAIMNNEVTPDDKINVIDVPAELRSTVEPQTSNKQPLRIEPAEFSFDEQVA